MSLPALHDFDQTRASLHRAAQVLSAVRKAVTPPLPNALRLSVYPVAQGVTTGPLSTGGDLLLDFIERALVYRQPGEPALSIALEGHTQASLAGALLALLAEEGHDIDTDGDSTADTAPLVIDAATAADYARALYAVFTATARFRARLFGPQSPVVVWPHGFDLSTLWFAGRGADEHSDPHMNFGFSPASPGFDRPYLYAYAYPLPAGFYDVALPALIQPVREPFKGYVVRYDDLAGLADPEAAVENLFSEIQRAVAPLMQEARS
jgi:hypothetical protein